MTEQDNSDLKRIVVIGADKPIVHEWVEWLRNRDKTVKERLLTSQKTDLNLSDLFETFDPHAVCLFPASSGGIEYNRTHAAELMWANTRTDMAVIESWRRGQARLIYVAASCVYPHCLDHDAREEDLWQGPLEPISAPYAVSKLWGMAALQSCLRKKEDLSYAVVIPATLYGSGLPQEEGTHVIEALAARFLKAVQDDLPRVTVWGSGKAVRDFLHRDDFFEALWMLIHSSHRDVFNLGSGEGVAIADLARTIAATIGFKGEIVFDTSRPDGAARKVLDITRAGHVLSWRPRVGLVEGLRRWFHEVQTGASLTRQGGSS